MKKGLLFGIALLLFPVVAAGCQDISNEDLMATLAPMEEKLNDVADELEEALGEYLPELEEKLPEIEKSLEEFLEEATPVYPEMDPINPEATKKPTPEPTYTPTSEPTNTPEPAYTPTPEPTNTPTPEPTNTPTSEPTNTPKPTPTNTPVPTPTNTPKPTPTNTPKPTPTNTPVPTPTNTPKPKPTNTPKPTPTNTPKPTKPNPAYCDHEYVVTEVVQTATDYLPGLRKYSCTICGKETERSYALPHAVDIGNGQTATVYGYWDLEKSAEMLRLLNEWRTKNGVPAVQDGMDGTARTRALECAYYYSHTRPNGERCFSAYEAYGVYAMAENIAAGYGGPEDVTNGWINSAGHNKNMLNATYRHASVSMFVVVNDTLSGEISELSHDYQYGRYYSQNFWE